MRRTIKILVDLPKDNLLMLLKTAAAVFNEHIEWAFASNSYNKNKAHKELYENLRLKYPDLPSGLLQSIRDTALEAVKSNKFRFKLYNFTKKGRGEEMYEFLKASDCFCKFYISS